MKSKDVKVQKQMLSKTGSVNVIITLPNGKKFDVSIDEDGEHAMIHHTTNINRICLRPLYNTSKVLELNENGSVRDIIFETKEVE